MCIGGDDAVATCVDTREILVVSVARFKRAILGVIGSVEFAADTIVDVLAEVGGIGL